MHSSIRPILNICLTLSLLATYATAQAETDRFGITLLYPTAVEGKFWQSTWDNGIARTFTGIDPKDSWFDANHGSATYRVDGAGLFKISGSTARMYIHDPAMAVASSWHNVELTVYAKRVADSNTAYSGIAGVARTNHGTTAPELSNLCDTRGISGRIRNDGHIDFEKETSHPNSTAIRDKSIWSGGLPKNIWIGYKYIVIDLPDGNVKLELWMDQTDGANGGTWVKINEWIDTGSNFGVGATACKAGIDPALRLTNADDRPGSESGKPNITIYFRADNVSTNGLIYKKMSVREITPIADTIPPVISSIIVNKLTENTATVSWTTNEQADTQVEYGFSTSYDQLTVLDPTLVVEHTANLVALVAGNTYHYRVRSKDDAGNLAVSLDQVITPAQGCMSSNGGWVNKFLPANGSTMTVEFDATPTGANIDGIMGLSNGATANYDDQAMSVRFNTSGKIDARNGSAYRAYSSIPYLANTTYHFKFQVNMATHTYNAYVNVLGGSINTIAKAFRFRSSQSASNTANNLGVIADVGGVSVCNLTSVNN